MEPASTLYPAPKVMEDQALPVCSSLVLGGGQSADSLGLSWSLTAGQKSTPSSWSIDAIYWGQVLTSSRTR